MASCKVLSFRLMSFFSFADFPKAQRDFSVAIVVSKFNEQITEPLLKLAFKTLKKCGLASKNIFVQEVPGAFEIPFAVKVLQASGNFDGILTLGCIVRGETPHFEFVARECARGVQDRNLFGAIPVIFGVLTCNDFAQGESRVRKGEDFAKALVLQMNFVNEIS